MRAERDRSAELELEAEALRDVARVMLRWAARLGAASLIARALERLAHRLLRCAYRLDADEASYP